MNSVGLPPLSGEYGLASGLSWGDDDIVYLPHYAPTDISVSKISVWVPTVYSPITPDFHLKAAIYNDNAGVPGDVIGTSDEMTFLSGELLEKQYYEIDFSSPVSLNSGELYHFAFMMDNTYFYFDEQCYTSTYACKYTDGRGYENGFLDDPSIHGTNSGSSSFLKIEGAMGTHYPHAFLLKISDNGSDGWVAINEIEFHLSGESSDLIDSYGADVYATQYTNPYTISRIIDNNTSNVWAESSYVGGEAHYFVIVEFHSNPGNIAKYSITGSPFSTETPTAWTLYAWNGGDWEEIDTQSSLSWTGTEKKTFNVTVDQIAGESGGGEESLIPVVFIVT